MLYDNIDVSSFDRQWDMKYPARSVLFSFRTSVLPPSSEGLVQFYQGDVFVGDGIAQFDLGIEITAPSK